VVLFNFINDATGNSDYVANIAIGGGQTGAASTTPTSVQVKYLQGTSVNQKFNMTWAGASSSSYILSSLY